MVKIRTTVQWHHTNDNLSEKTSKFSVSGDTFFIRGSSLCMINLVCRSLLSKLHVDRQDTFWIPPEFSIQIRVCFANPIRRCHELCQSKSFPSQIFGYNHFYLIFSKLLRIEKRKMLVHLLVVTFGVFASPSFAFAVPSLAFQRNVALHSNHMVCFIKSRFIVY